jgi:hypothetical protein
VNLPKCEKCGAELIQEELDNHACFTGKIERILWCDWNDYAEAFDGRKTYKIWLPREVKHADETRGDEIAP